MKKCTNDKVLNLSTKRCIQYKNAIKKGLTIDKRKGIAGSQQEIKEYESILQLCPSDNDTLFKLGVLYFQQGFNSKGLKVYEALKQHDGQKAEQLINFYGENSHSSHGV